MIRWIFSILFAYCLFSGVASGQTCSSYPYTLTNGTTADASQVMANFDHVRDCANNQTVASLFRGWLGGLTMSNDAGTPNTVIDTSAGVANSDDSTTIMTLTAITKNANSGWAVGTSNGCLDSGSNLANNTWYHLFVIARTDTSVVDQLCSTSATAPTLPTNYTKKRRIGSFKTDGSAHILAFKQLGDQFLWAMAVNDMNAVSVGTTAQLITLTVPPGVQVDAISNFEVTGTDASVLFTSPDENNQAIASGRADGYSATTAAFGRIVTRTNLSGQVRVVTNATTRVDEYTRGWNDTRGRFQ